MPRYIAPKKDMQKRLYEKIMHEPNTGCWFWTGSLNNKGYGTIHIDHTTKLAHRVVFEFCKHKIPDSLKACHTCDNTMCVNPDHIFLGTQKDNVHDMVRKNRHWNREGEKAPYAKFNPSQIIEIRRRRLSGESNWKLAEDYDVHRKTISAITTRKTYNNVH